MTQKYSALAGRIIELVGGPDNVRSAIHCQTRLRFDLRDESKADTVELDHTEGVVTALSSGGMYQVVIGTHVKDVFEEVDARLKAAGVGSTDGPDNAPSKPMNPLERVIDFIAGSFIPIIPAIAGAGMIKAVLSLLVVFNWVSDESATYRILDFFSGAVFYYLPIILGVSCAIKLKSNPYLAAAIAAIMVHPTWVAIVAEGAEAGASTVMLFDAIPLTLTGYSNTVIPILLVVLVQSYVEKWLYRIMPKSIEVVFVPLFTLLIMGILALAVLGPIGAIAGDWLAEFFTWLANNIPWAPAVFIGSLWPIMVMFGVHTAVGPMGFIKLGQTGYDDIVGPGIIVSNISQGVAALTVGVITLDKKLKQIAISTGITGLMGITEPALYGVNLPKRYPLVAAIAGGGVGGFYAGLMGVRRFATGHSGLPALPMYIGDDTLYNLIHICIGLIIAAAVTATITAVFALRERRADAAALRLESATATADAVTASNAPVPAALAAANVAAGGIATAVATTTELSSPCNGTVVLLDQVPDKAFAAGAMGPGIGIEPSDGAIVAPCAGEVVVAMDTGHAFGIRSADGYEVLVHVGVNTVSMKGDGFDHPVTKGTRVEAGQRLVVADLDKIAAAGHRATVIMVVTNSKGASVRDLQTGTVVAGEPVVAVHEK